MIEFLMVALLCSMVILLIVIAGLVADNNRISREIHAKNIEVAWHKAIVEAFIGKVERERGKSDIVERLRVYIRFEHPKDYETHIVWQAADEIERLREALRLIAYGENDMQVNRINARAALGEGKE